MWLFWEGEAGVVEGRERGISVLCHSVSLPAPLVFCAILYAILFPPTPTSPPHPHPQPD